MNSLCLLPALLLDRVCGEPARLHPLVGFGAVAVKIEASLYRETHLPSRQILSGLLAWALLVLPPVALLIGVLVLLPVWASVIVSILILYFSLGLQSLREHAEAIAIPLRKGNIELARQQVGFIVSRDTATLDSNGITRATVESVLENGADAVIAPLFWFLVAGAPGALLHRLVNTLDAQWGYLSPRYRYFGRVAARADDILNWLPARLCALLYCAAGNFSSGWRCWHTQGALTPSPNAGRVMAAGAGALGIQIGGPTLYRGNLEQRPTLGCGEPAGVNDAVNTIHRALGLVTTASWIMASFSIVFGLLLWSMG